MSRIHEALKRAEQERTGSAPPEKGEAHPELVITPKAAETVLPPPTTLPPAVAPVPPVSPVQPAHTNGHANGNMNGHLRFEELQERCRKTDWRPNPSLLVFGNLNPFFPGAEQFRTLRSRLYRIRETQPLQAIMISSAIPAEGKTLIATNLAYAMVRQRGCRVLLIDADLRSPRIHTLLGAPETPGLADYLQNTATEFETIQRGPEEGLCFVPAGNHATHPSELISSSRMRQFLDRVRPAFDWIIIDTPPALPVADPSVLGSLVDGVLLVVRANSTPSEASQKACKELQDAHILGVILNTAEESSGYNSYYSGEPYGNSAKGQKK
jgi:protein-tyrosine kinase